MSRRTGWLRPVAGALLGLSFLGLLARRVEWDTVGALLAGARPLPLVAALALLASGMTIRIARWWWMLRAFDPGLPLAGCVRPFLGSLALNNTVPLRAGDVVRAVGFRRALRAPPARVIGTLLVERLLDLLVLLLIFSAALFGAAARFPRSFLLVVSAAGAVALAALVVLVFAPGLVGHLAERALRWRGLPARWQGRLAPHLHHLVESLTVLRVPGRAALLLGASLLAWLVEGGVFAAAAWSLGVTAPPPAPWLALGAATLATLLPSAPGYLGTFDWFATLGFTAYGTSHSAAAAVALLTHLLLWLPVTVAGFAALALRPAPVAAPMETGRA